MDNEIAKQVGRQLPAMVHTDGSGESGAAGQAVSLGEVGCHAVFDERVQRAELHVVPTGRDLNVETGNGLGRPSDSNADAKTVRVT